MRWTWLVLVSLWLLLKSASYAKADEVVKILPPTSQRVENGEGTVYLVGTKNKDVPHYEIIEYCNGCETVEAETGGFFQIAEGQGNLGPNSFATFSIHAQAMGAMISKATIGPLTVHHRLEVIWQPGEEGAPEPRQGLTIHFTHYVDACVETFGIGAEKLIGTAKGKANAYTCSPAGFLEVVSESQCSGIGTNADPQGKKATLTLRGVKSGWSGYLDAVVSGSVTATLGGYSNASATAQVSWQAELP